MFVVRKPNTKLNERRTEREMKSQKEQTRENEREAQSQEAPGCWASITRGRLPESGHSLKHSDGNTFSITGSSR